MKWHEIHVDESDKLTHLVTWQDVEPVLDLNKRLQNESQRRAGAFHHVGFVPDVFALKWFNEEWERGHRMRWMDEEHMRIIWRKLQDPDWKFLRTTDRQL